MLCVYGADLSAYICMCASVQSVEQTFGAAAAAQIVAPAHSSAYASNKGKGRLLHVKSHTHWFAARARPSSFAAMPHKWAKWMKSSFLKIYSVIDHVLISKSDKWNVYGWNGRFRAYDFEIVNWPHIFSSRLQYNNEWLGITEKSIDPGPYQTWVRADSPFNGCNMNISSWHPHEWED